MTPIIWAIVQPLPDAREYSYVYIYTYMLHVHACTNWTYTYIHTKCTCNEHQQNILNKIYKNINLKFYFVTEQTCLKKEMDFLSGDLRPTLTIVGCVTFDSFRCLSCFQFQYNLRSEYSIRMSHFKIKAPPIIPHIPVYTKCPRYIDTTTYILYMLTRDFETNHKIYHPTYSSLWWNVKHRYVDI